MPKVTVPPKVKHTPGPWTIAHDADFSATYDFEGDRVPTHEEAPHNAKLIAAAPSLLEALQTMFNKVTCLSNDTTFEAIPVHYTREELKKAFDAIQKATL